MKYEDAYLRAYENGREGGEEYLTKNASLRFNQSACLCKVSLHGNYPILFVAGTVRCWNAAVAKHAGIH